MKKIQQILKAPENVTSELASAVYTHAQGTWTAISSSDARIRGYKIYANGKLVNTVYNYQIPKFATAETVSKQIGRLTPGTENTVEIVAFTDAGVEYKYHWHRLQHLAAMITKHRYLQKMQK